MKLLLTIVQLVSQRIRATPMQRWAKETVPDALQQAFIPSVAYRVHVWPSLQDEFKTAANYRVLSTMYVEAVTWEWLVGSLSNTAALLRRLLALKLLQVVKAHYALSEKTPNECINEQVKPYNTFAPQKKRLNCQFENEQDHCTHPT